MAAHFRGNARVHFLFLANYVVLVVLFGVLCSEVCGEPRWYGARTHPPVTPEGHLQYVSEHIMRCKYSDSALLQQVPWLTVYAFAVLLMQVLHTWVSLHMIEALQVRYSCSLSRTRSRPRRGGSSNARAATTRGRRRKLALRARFERRRARVLAGVGARETAQDKTSAEREFNFLARQIARLQAVGAAQRGSAHALFVAVMFVSLLGFLGVVRFDHDYLPDVRSGAATARVWTDHSRAHASGVLATIGGFFALHLLVLHAYLMRVQSLHDFRDMCAGLAPAGPGPGGEGDAWLAQAPPAETSLMPVLRRGVYAGCEATYASVFVLFVVLFVFRVEIVVLVEYLLLLVFLIVSVVNLLLSHRIWRVYRVPA